MISLKMLKSARRSLKLLRNKTMRRPFTILFQEFVIDLFENAQECEKKPKAVAEQDNEKTVHDTFFRSLLLISLKMLKSAKRSQKLLRNKTMRRPFTILFQDCY